MIRFKGCGTALVTPFRDGAVDMDAYRNLVMRQVASGIDFLVPLGTTAETPCLDDQEKIDLLLVTKEMAGQVPVVAGCGTNSLTSTVRNMELLSPCNPDAFLVVVPFYNKPTQEGMYQYFKAVAASTDKPLILYNVPGRTGANMLAETTLRLAEIPNIVAVKEASGKIDQILEIVRHAPDGFSVLSGNDDQTFELMKNGADGIVSVVSNLVPGRMKALTEALSAGRMEEAAVLDKGLAPLYKACFVESNPIPVKGGLSVLGLCSSEMRLPLTPAVESTMNLMKEILL